MTTSGGALQGFMIAEHTVPADASIMELKCCENCGCPFMRKRVKTEPFVVKRYLGERLFETVILRRDRGAKYCMKCQAKALTPVDLSDYKETFPGSEQQMQHSLRLPKYDKPRNCFVRGPKPQLGDWKTKLRRIFLERGPMTLLEMKEITGHKTALSVRNSCDPPIVYMVACVYPRPIRPGQPVHLYAVIL